MKNEQQHSVLELQARWEKIRVANVYDVLDKMGYPNQCLDLSIRPLFSNRRLAGIAFTVKGARDPRTVGEFEEGKGTPVFLRIRDMLRPGMVIVAECGGENITGKFGEMTSWSFKQKGAKGLVLDSYIRDYLGLEAIPDYTVCAKGTSPIESYRRWRPQEVNVPIGMPGSLTAQVRVVPGDWVVAESDGVIIVPQEIAMEVLIKAEDLEAREESMRRDLAAGIPFDEAYAKWGRA